MCCSVGIYDTRSRFHLAYPRNVHVRPGRESNDVPRALPCHLQAAVLWHGLDWSRLILLTHDALVVVTVFPPRVLLPDVLRARDRGGNDVVVRGMRNLLPREGERLAVGLRDDLLSRQH